MKRCQLNHPPCQILPTLAKIPSTYISLPRLKTGTRKSVKSKTINSAANSPSRGLTTKETVTAQGVNNRDNEDTNDSNRPDPSIRDNNNGHS